MAVGHPSIRVSSDNPLHHLWLNNGTWWVHYTLNFDFRTRRVRRSLGTRDAAEAVRRRDELFARLAREGEWVEDRGDGGPRMLDLPLTRDSSQSCDAWAPRLADRCA